mmetsp:Transcript_94946/g.307097  ORF Transcript_94946/g.307097 Transcript_94946/m.307097 type:complete len:344 (+) Transcript_94946:567-1598(+)
MADTCHEDVPIVAELDVRGVGLEPHLRENGVPRGMDNRNATRNCAPNASLDVHSKTIRSAGSAWSRSQILAQRPRVEHKAPDQRQRIRQEEGGPRWALLGVVADPQKASIVRDRQSIRSVQLLRDQLHLALPHTVDALAPSAFALAALVQVRLVRVFAGLGVQVRTAELRPLLPQEAVDRVREEHISAGGHYDVVRRVQAAAVGGSVCDHLEGVLAKALTGHQVRELDPHDPPRAVLANVEPLALQCHPVASRFEDIVVASDVRAVVAAGVSGHDRDAGRRVPSVDVSIDGVGEEQRARLLQPCRALCPAEAGSQQLHRVAREDPVIIHNLSTFERAPTRAIG